MSGFILFPFIVLLIARRYFLISLRILQAIVIAKLFLKDTKYLVFFPYELSLKCI